MVIRNAHWQYAYNYVVRSQPYTENGIGESGAIMISELLKTNTTLTSLDLSSARMNSRIEMCRIKRCLKVNMIWGLGITMLSEALIINNTLIELNLTSNLLILTTINTQGKLIVLLPS